MRKLSFLALFSFVILQSFGQVWKPMDSKNSITDPKIAAADDGNVYIVGRIHGKTASAVLYKYDGNALSTIYTPDFTKIHNDVAIGLGANQLPIIAYSENGVAMVKQFDGKTLVDLSSESPAPKGFNYFKMATDKAGTPYVFYYHSSVFYVKKFENGSWSQLAESKGFMGDYRIAFNSRNEPYIAFKDKRFVKRIEGGTLVDVAPTYYKSSTSEFNIAIDNNDVIYICYSAFENGVLKLVKLEGQEWKPLPDPTSADYPNKGGELPVMAFDSNNNMYFSCS
ncbi:MAG TPA: hypothetical protein VIK89_08105, partial [Cytophagaceae bacterium]